MSRSSVSLHWGRGHLVSRRRDSSGETISDAMQASIAGMWSRPTAAASCIAARVRASAERRAPALVSAQLDCSSLMKSPE